MRTLKEYSGRKYYKAPFFAKPGHISDLFGYGSFESNFSLKGNFALIDLETNSISPKDGKIIEIAIVIMDIKGKILNKFSTLLNPEDGNIGRTDIHEIALRDVKKAPTFSQVAGNILQLLEGSVVVAHNAKFEEGFLCAEFANMDLEIPIIPALDTMWLAQMELDIFNYKLPTVLSHYGHAIVDAHTALGDVISIAKFLPELLKQVPSIEYPVDLMELPNLPIHTKLLPRHE